MTLILPEGVLYILSTNCSGKNKKANDIERRWVFTVVRFFKGLNGDDYKNIMCYKKTKQIQHVY